MANQPPIRWHKNDVPNHFGARVPSRRPLKMTRFGSRHLVLPHWKSDAGNHGTHLCGVGWWVCGGVLFSRPGGGSIFGVRGLSFRVRDGSGRFPRGYGHRHKLCCCLGLGGVGRVLHSGRGVWLCCWLVSAGQLSVLRRVHVRSIDPVVYRVPSTPREAFGNVVVEGVSRLDAFSGYPVRTWLTSGALGRTTGVLEVRPSRSSRTRDSSPRVSLRAQRIGTELSHDVLNPARVPL